ncbi:MAG: hypothetical protein FJ360_03865 [Thaumarchaeota archaeon]|nr:hypothetical protein [Nitrososphaerota archaeon]
MMPSLDTRKKSLSEAFVNSFGGYPIGYAIGIIILPLSVGWIEKDPFTVNIFITFIYATVSFVRTYYLRRVFVRLGFDDNFIRLGTKLYKKVVLRLVKVKLKQSDPKVSGLN